MQNLLPGTLLQHGKYRIERVLGQGGFGITYLAENTMLEGKVAIKEFFFKEYCERGETKSSVTVPTSANREIVERFKQKFIKEARTIFRLNHPNIVRILDIFEENDTAYYVMEHIDGESLGDLVKRRGALPEQEALGYIRQAADALSYIHGERMNHLDVKPGNLMKRAKDGRVILIDFGVAKQYDALTSEGTTTTPVGISHGYSPAEQYRKNGVQNFSPSSDVYALAATLFKLLTGNTPPEAMEVNDDGLPLDELRAKGVSESVVSAIVMAMKGRNERTQSAAEFVENLGNASTDETIPVTEATLVVPEETVPVLDVSKPKERSNATPSAPQTQKSQVYVSYEPSGPYASKAKSNTWKWIVGGAAAVALVVGGIAAIPHLTDNGLAHSEKDSIDSSIAATEASYTNNVLTVGDVTYEMVPVEGGTFTMGATSEQGSDAESDERPTHNVTLSNYSIGKTEVTQELWEAVMGSNPSEFKGANKPVENVSWNDCQTFIGKLNNLTGKQFRLPTEAEWEYSARGGQKSQGYKYSGSNSLGDVAWYNNNSGSSIHDVATKRPNELGLYDMSGNVREWCSDWYGDYSSNSQTNPEGPTSGQYRVSRGGCWGINAWICRSSSRSGNEPDRRGFHLGLRLVLSE